MEQQKGPYFEDVERNRIFSIALIYEQTADKLAPWDAAAAEECYQKNIDLLMPLAPVSYGLADTLLKLEKVQRKQGKINEADSTHGLYEEMNEKLSEIEKEVRMTRPDLKTFTSSNHLFSGLNLPNAEHDRKLFGQYKSALDPSLYPKDVYPELCSYFKKRGISLCVGNPTGGLLITGINPSRPIGVKDGDFVYTLKNEATPHKGRIGYWRQKYNLVGNKLIDQTAYLDLMPLCYTNQVGLEYLLWDNVQLRAALVSITQREIESYIRPSLIIVANKQSAYYWGKDDSMWMGYEMIPMSHGLSKDLELYQITGFKKGQRLNPDLQKTNLKGALILFYGMYDERNKEKLLSDEDVVKLLQLAQNNKGTSKI